MREEGAIAVRLAFIAVLVSLFIFATPAAASAEEGGSMLPNLNPFSYKKRQRKAPTSARASDSKGGGWKMPRLWPEKKGQQVAERRPTGAPTALQKMNAGTKQFFSETADAQSLQRREDNAPPAKVTGSSSMFRQASKKPETKSTSFLPSWPWGAKEEEKKPKTVSEFLMQPKPDFQSSIVRAPQSHGQRPGFCGQAE
jgi:hypothetical protein